MTRACQRRADTAARILDVAERLAQCYGFNGFRYADIAAELQLTTASLHDHCAGTAELGRVLRERYTERFLQALAGIEARLPAAPERPAASTQLSAELVREERLCLCGMFAAEDQTLPDAMRDAVLGFFDANEAWLVRILKDGRTSGQPRFAAPAGETAGTMVAGLEGAMLLAGPSGESERFQTVAQQLLQGVTARAASDGPARAAPLPPP